MSTKDWKNKELSENLNKKWGFKMDLKKLNEAHCGTSESHCNEEEEKLEEEEKTCPECKKAKEDCVCPDKKKKMEENEEKPDFPDIDKDGNRDESITQAQKDKKEKEGNDGKKKDLSKVPPQLRKHVAKK